MLHNSPGTFLMPKISAKFTRGSPPTRHQMQMGYVKCSRGSWKLATVDAKRCHLSSLRCSASRRVCQRQLILVLSRNIHTSGWKSDEVSKITKTNKDYEQCSMHTAKQQQYTFCIMAISFTLGYHTQW